jgi:hypothetical protein
MTKQDKAKIQVIVSYLRLTEDLLADLEMEENDKYEKREATNLVDTASTEALAMGSDVLNQASKAIEAVADNLDAFLKDPKGNC